MKNSRLLGLIEIILIMVAILSVSIALPIICRPMYYLMARLLKVPQQTGWDFSVIREAYDQMMDYCMGLTSTFSTGQLAYSESGAMHFADVRSLFILDFVLAIVSVISLLIIHFLKKRNSISSYRFYDHSSGCTAAKILLAVFVCIVLLSLGNFDRTFVIFHRIFFPGKSNWIFDPRYDQIIDILPEEVFMYFAIAIFILISTTCLWLIIKDYRKR